MMLAYFVFGASSPQRNPDFRIASQKFLIDLVSQVCQETDSFHITLQAVGDQGRLRWPVPKNAQVPIRAFLADHGVMFKGDVETTPAMAFSSPATASIRKGARG